MSSTRPSLSIGPSSSDFIGQLRRRLAHVQLACHYVGDEAGAVLLDQLDLTASAGDGGVDVRSGLVEVFDDGACSWRGGIATFLEPMRSMLRFPCVFTGASRRNSRFIARNKNTSGLGTRSCWHGRNRPRCQENRHQKRIATSPMLAAHGHYKSSTWKHGADRQTLFVQCLGIFMISLLFTCYVASWGMNPYGPCVQ